MTLRLVLMGVAGCGKTSVGLALSRQLGVGFVDADDLHPAANVAKMRAGQPLTDADRWPWLDQVAAVLTENAPVIVACSALRRAYRDHLRDNVRQGAGRAGLRFVHLAGPPALIATRLAGRSGHFMPPSLLDSQFATLDPPTADEALTVEIDQPLGDIVAQIRGSLGGP